MVTHKRSCLSKIVVLGFGALLFFAYFGGNSQIRVVAQSQSVIAFPGYINLGMNSTIVTSAPSAGSYTVVVQKPDGSQFALNETFASAGESQNTTFGSASSGFKGVVDQVGTYNVFVEKGTEVVATTSFYATNKLNVFMDMVNGGTCIYVNGVNRGYKIFPRFYVTYASNGAPFTNNTKGAFVTYSLPNGTVINATWHKPNTVSQSTVGFFIGKYQPNWNDTHVGPWNPNATAGDAYGNVVKYHYIGVPFVISPASLSTTATLVDSKTNQTLAGLGNGTTATILAVVTYPTNAEAAPGFVAPLDSAIRGGKVTANVGWGYYNATSGTFGGAKNPGGQIAQVTMSYTGKSGIWEGNFTTTSVPAIKTGTSYEIVINSQDKAAPQNTGLAIFSLAPAAIGSAVSTSTSSSAPSQSTTTTTSATNIAATIPLWAYAGTTIALIVGVIVGFLARRPK